MVPNLELGTWNLELFRVSCGSRTHLAGLEDRNLCRSANDTKTVFVAEFARIRVLTGIPNSGEFGYGGKIRELGKWESNPQ